MDLFLYAQTPKNSINIPKGTFPTTSKLYLSMTETAAKSWQVSFEKQSTHFHVFKTLLGTYHSYILPSGLCSAPKAFHRKLQWIFCGTADKAAFLSGEKTVQEHGQKTLEGAKPPGLQPNKSKCCVIGTMYLGDKLT